MIHTAYSTNRNVKSAVSELQGRLGDDASLVLFFASPAYEPKTLAAAMRDAFPDAATVGCTTAGELASGRMLEKSLVAMSIGSDEIGPFHVETVRDLRARAEDGVKAALQAFEATLGVRMKELDRDRWAGFVLTDGLSVAEERVMETLSDATNAAFVGGSAGDDLAFKVTHVSADGEALTDACVLVLFEAQSPFEIVKTQSFKVLPRRLTASRVDPTTRTVYEFDGRPAARAYAEALGTDVADLPNHFMKHPLGLMVSDTEPFVRSPQQVNGDAVVFYCAMREGMELALLEGGDIVRDTAAALNGSLRKGATPRGIVNFNCILRTLQLRSEGKAGAYGEIFAKTPTIGFSTYGEACIGHINQTSTMLVFY
jgi:hypothetical protein